MEAILKKDKAILERTYGAVQELKRLQKNLVISNKVYEAELAIHLAAISGFLDHSITTEDEMDSVFDFFIGSEGASSKSAKTAGLLSFVNVALVISVILVVIAGGLVIDYHLMPIIMDLPKEIKIALSYVGAVSILASGKRFFSETAQGYVGFIGALALAAAYFYSLSFFEPAKEPSVYLLLLPVLLAWGYISIYYRSKLVGFITVAVFEVMLGFFVWSGPLCFVTGFKNEDTAHTAMVVSGGLVLIYILYATKGLSFAKDLERIIRDVFGPGILFLGTFVHYTALLILSSGFYNQGETLFTYNVLAGVVGLGSFYLGHAVKGMGVFRGVAGTFFVLFLIQKYIEIPWGGSWSLGLLGGALLLTFIGLFIKSHPHLFAFY